MKPIEPYNLYKNHEYIQKHIDKACINATISSLDQCRELIVNSVYDDNLTFLEKTIAIAANLELVLNKVKNINK